MVFRYGLLIGFVLALISCNTHKKNDLETNKSSQEPIIYLQEPIKLNKEAQNYFKEWKDYSDFNEFFNQFIKTTQSDALNNAKELNTLATRLRDSLNIKVLNIPAFKARLNVLQNETMRLEDMTTINNLKTKAIEAQLNKILNAFNATNAKLNNLILQKQVEKDLSQLKDSV